MRIIFYGLKRSGNHAIIYWILRNLQGSEKLCEIVPSYIHLGTNSIFFNDVTSSEGAILIEKDKWINQKKEHIIISVEDANEWKPSRQFAELLGPEEFIPFYIIRNPLNCYASRFCTFGFSDIYVFVRMYKNFIEKTKNNNVIYYDKWNSDKNYRDEVSKMFGVSNIDIHNIKTLEGGGSVFSDDNYNERYKDIPENILSKLNELL